MVTQEQHDLIHRWFSDVLTNKQIDVLDELLAPDFIYYDPSDRVISLGSEGFKEWLRWYHTTFHNGQWLLHDVISSGDRIVVRYSGLVTYQGGLFDIPVRDEERVKDMGIAIFSLKEGKINALWSAMCSLDLV